MGFFADTTLDLQTESLHFKNRILDFFDVFARRQPENPLILEILLPLLNIAKSTGSSEGDLANKAASILRTRIGKAKEIPHISDPLPVSVIMKSIHKMARKTPSAEVSNLCSACSLLVARALDEPDSDLSAFAYRATLSDYMLRKASSLHPAFILDYIRRFPTKAWGLHETLCIFVKPGGIVKVYRKTQAYGMLQTLYQHLAVISKALGGEVVRAGIRRASGCVLDTLEAATDTTSDTAKDWNAARLKEVAKFALQLARTSRSALETPSSKIWDLERLEEVVVKMKESERTREMKSLHGLLHQLSVVSNVNGATKSKKEKKEKKEKKGKKGGSEERMDVDEETRDIAAIPATLVTNGESEAARAKRSTEGKKQRREERRSIEDPANGRPVVNGSGVTTKAKKRKTAGRTEGDRKPRVVANGSHPERSQKKHKSSIQST